MPTEYRTIHDGYREYLQYKTVKTINLFFFKTRKTLWYYVPSEWYDLFDYRWENWRSRYGFEENVSMNYAKYINSDRYNLEDFVRTWPNVEDWYKSRNKIVNERIKKQLEEEQIRNEKKGTIKRYFQ